jgi:SDR family mycofactocin-dependent oxidoreductase
MRPLNGKVAFITGAARGQGRAHAVRLARDGANIIALDICADIASMDYPNANATDLAETVRLVEAEGGRIVATQADVRDFSAVDAAFRAGVAEFGRLDIIVANAGIIRLSPSVDPLTEWRDVIDVNLTGVFHTIHAAVPTLIDGGRGGSIVITSSSAGLKVTGSNKPGGQAYNAAKRGLVGYAQTLALELAPHSIRVNTIHPTGVATGMILNDAMAAMFADNDPGLAAMQNALPIQMLQPEDIANAVAWLVSDEAHYITGTAWPLDAGFSIR